METVNVIKIKTDLAKPLHASVTLLLAKETNDNCSRTYKYPPTNNFITANDENTENTSYYITKRWSATDFFK